MDMREPSRWNRWVPGLLVATLLVGCSEKVAAPEPVRAVRTERIQPTAAGATQDYAAEVRPRIESRLGFRVPGKLLRRLVDLGAEVKAGQVLAQLDPSDLRLSQDAARAAVNAAQVNHDQTAADFRRFQDLHRQGFISAADLERRDTALKAAQAQLEQAKAQLGAQTNQAAYSSLAADAAGVITAVDAEPGMVLAAGAPVVRLAHRGPRDAVFSVPEDRASEARKWLNKPGLVKVQLWGQQTPVTATVREVAAAADPATRTFLVKADLGAAPVRLGQTATVTVGESVTGEQHLTVPMSAILEKDGKQAVWILDPSSMKVTRRPVDVVGTDGSRWIVGQGLKAGDEIVTAGVHVLTDGQVVKRWGVALPQAGQPPASAASQR